MTITKYLSLLFANNIYLSIYFLSCPFEIMPFEIIIVKS